MPREHYLPDYILQTVNVGGGGIMAWDCFSGVGLGPLLSVKGNLNALANTFYSSMLPTF